jgi:hypothetical protein
MTGTVYHSDGYIAYPKDPAFSAGKKIRKIAFSRTLTSAGVGHTNGDTFVLARNLTVDSRLVAIKGSTPALTSANDCDLGFYKKNEDGTFTSLGSGATGDELWNGVDLSSALSYRELLFTLNTSLDRTKNIGDLLSLTSEQQPPSGIYLILRLNTGSSAASAVLPLEIEVEEANTH